MILTIGNRMLLIDTNLNIQDTLNLVGLVSNDNISIMEVVILEILL